MSVGDKARLKRFLETEVVVSRLQRLESAFLEKSSYWRNFVFSKCLITVCVRVRPDVFDRSERRTP